MADRQSNHSATSVPTVAEYVVARLAALGIEHAFGVPGDYTFPFDDAIEANADITWIGNANELNAAYAADGYARIRGAAILSTTYGVGELSALNGVMGSKAERLPVFHLVGQPSTKLQRARSVTHHTLGDGVFGQFEPLSGATACASAHLTPLNAVAEMERVIDLALTQRRPAYITVPQDFALRPVIGTAVDGVRLAQVPQPTSDPGVLAAAIAAIRARYLAATSRVVLPAYTIGRYGLQAQFEQFLQTTGLTYATTTMDKAVVSESTPGFLGMYVGLRSGSGVREAVEGADFVLDLGGVIFADTNTGGWTDALDPAKIVTVWPDHVQIGEDTFGPTSLADVIAQLTVALSPTVRNTIPAAPPAAISGADDDHVSSASLYPRLQQFLQNDDIVFAETGQCAGHVSALRFPAGAVYHNQTLWGSIGWATPAAFGASLADTRRRTILVTGDGSHQLTGNDVGTMGRYGAKPIIIVLNNAMYGIEEVVNETRGHEYDFLAPWSYHQLPAALGCENWYTARVTTNKELDTALQKAAAHDDASYIEVVLGSADIPASLPPEVLNHLYRTT